MKIFIVIPAHNEEKRITRTLKIYSSYFEKLRKQEKLNYTIFIVINASSDKTLQIVKSASNQNRNISYIDLKEGGKGYAVTEGFKIGIQKKADLIGFVDADASTPPEAFYQLISSIGQDDGVIASRYIPGAKVNPLPSAGRIVVSRVYNMFIRTLFFLPYHDTQCGAKLFKRSALERVVPKLKITQWAFDVDILYNLKKAEYSVREVPTVWSDSNYSKLNVRKTAPRMALSMIRLRILNSPFKGLIKLYNSLPGSYKIKS